MCCGKMNFNIIEIQGDATLCFTRNSVDFQGIITATDGAQYAIYGTKATTTPRNNYRDRSYSIPGDLTQLKTCDCKIDETTQQSNVLYDIRIVDCEAGEEYSLKHVHGRNGNDIKLRCKGVSFQPTQTFRGFKADMVAKERIGRILEGKHLLCEGKLRAVVQPVVKKKHWVL